MSALHKEIEFENDICTHLAAHDWLHAEHPQGVGRGCKDAEASTTTHSDHATYDRTRALFPADVLAWVQATQPQAWDTLTKNHGAAAEATLLDLSQIFDYGNTAIEKRAIFFRRLLPLLEFGREREGVDLSRVVLTHHKLKNQGKLALPLGAGEPFQPLTEPGSGEVREKEKARLAEIIEKVNTLFEGELSDDDKLVYVNHVLKGKLLESAILAQQASNNTKEQFSNSPDLANELMNAIMDALSAHTTMSKQALDSEKVRGGLKDILLGPARLYEALREQARP